VNAVQVDVFCSQQPMYAAHRRRQYSTVLTAEVNRKGVLDVDTVKGCAAGMAGRPMGCYGACYAAATARFRGIDFTKAVTRTTYGAAHTSRIEHAVKMAPHGLFRVGTMGDPCHDWEHTVQAVEWLASYAVPVVVTKHWYIATDEQLRRLVRCGAVLNTSVSALDTAPQLSHREGQVKRYARLGGVSVSRAVSCDFDRSHPTGLRLADIQDRLLSQRHVIDNPLRIPTNHELVVSGVVRVHARRDLATVRMVSVARDDTYIGHCDMCPEKCGVAFCGPSHPRPRHPQQQLL